MRTPPVPATTEPLRIVTVSEAHDFHRFILVPWSIYAEDPAWVPVLVGGACLKAAFPQTALELKRGVREVELSHILEDHMPMQNMLASHGSIPYNRYRM